MHATIANDTSVSEFCTEQGFWASIKPITRHLYVNPEGQLRAQGCKILLGQLTAVARSWRPYSGMNPSFGMQIRSSGDRTDRQIAYRRISPPTGLDPVGDDAGAAEASSPRTLDATSATYARSTRCRSASSGPQCSRSTRSRSLLPGLK